MDQQLYSGKGGGGGGGPRSIKRGAKACHDCRTLSRSEKSGEKILFSTECTQID